jgi:hypothetical protein
MELNLRLPFPIVDEKFSLVVTLAILQGHAAQGNPFHGEKPVGAAKVSAVG